jgi:hypothetical protein
MQAGIEEDFKTYLEATRDEPIFVILGSQGSGTNLLGRLLVRIFGFSLMLDRSLVFNAAVRLGSTPSKEATTREIRWVMKHLFPSALTRKRSKYSIADCTPFEGIEDELRPENIRNGADFARIIYAYRAYRLGTRRMAIKSDDIWEHIDAMDDVIPNRRIVLLTRDFRDNLVSVSGKTFGPIDPICSALYVKERVSRYAAEYRRAGTRGAHVRFDTLVNDTPRFVNDFSGQFGLKPTADPGEVIEAFAFRPNKIGKWNGLSRQQLAWCEGILREELLEFGYPLASPTPVVPDRSVVRAATVRDALKRVPQKVRRALTRVNR